MFKVVKKKVELKDIWKAAWKLHTDCFHEERMNLREVKTLASIIKVISNRI
ncbi:MAG: PaREP1 family protein [Sulfolobaceae archaeon]